ncbi:MAG: methyltransferase domain-containing protein [Nitrospirae bacterium]|nr:methyltransferase domain-containing protein [Nitrospirota bacterium]
MSFETTVCKYCNSPRTFNFLEDVYPLFAFPLDKKVKAGLKKSLASFVTNLKYFYCYDCGFVFSNISGDENKIIGQIYSQHYNYISPLLTGIASSEADDFVEITRPYFKNVSQVLEIGCFDGYVLKKLKDEGINVLGIEPGGNAACIARGAGIDVINSFFPAGEIGTRKFDVVFSRHVIEHVDNVYDFLSGQLKLTDTGTIIFETPSLDWFILNDLSEAFHPQHQILLGHKFILRLLRDLSIPGVSLLEREHRTVCVAALRPSEMFCTLDQAMGNILNTSSQVERKLASFQRNIKEKKDILTGLLSKHISNGDSIAVWGGGSFTGNLLAQVEELRKVEYIIDSDPRKCGMEFLHSDVDIFSPDVLKDKGINVLIIFSQFADEIVSRLSELNLNKTIKTIYRTFPVIEVITN